MPDNCNLRRSPAAVSFIYAIFQLLALPTRNAGVSLIQYISGHQHCALEAVKNSLI
jgi:hypothetical protein